MENAITSEGEPPMSRIALTGILMALAGAGCNQNNTTDDQTAFQSEQYRSKPMVTLIPVINSTQAQVEWNLSDELSSEIFYQLSQTRELTLTAPNKVRAMVKKLKENQNPFGTDIHWVKQTFAQDQFVIFLELTEHEEVLRQDRKKPSLPEDCTADLKMSMRIRVFDVREEEPKVVLQEIIHDSHFVPRPFTHINFYQTSWEDENFAITPLGLAHAQFTKEISSRLKDYILLSQE